MTTETIEAEAEAVEILEDDDAHASALVRFKNKYYFSMRSDVISVFAMCLYLINSKQVRIVFDSETKRVLAIDDIIKNEAEK